MTSIRRARTWLLADHARRRNGPRQNSNALLAGKLFDDRGNPMSPTPDASGAFCADKHANLMAAKDQLTTSGPADSSGSFTTIVRPVQKGLAFRSAWSIVSSSDAARMMRG